MPVSIRIVVDRYHQNDYETLRIIGPFTDRAAAEKALEDAGYYLWPKYRCPTYLKGCANRDVGAYIEDLLPIDSPFDASPEVDEIMAKWKAVVDASAQRK